MAHIRWPGACAAVFAALAAACTLEFTPPSDADPIAPQPYAPPSPAVRVTTTSELVAALAATQAADIVLADGEYLPDAHLAPAAAHRLWAEHLGGATIHAGIVFGTDVGDPGGELHGVRLDTGDRSRTLEGMYVESSLVHVWGVRRNVKIQDAWLSGHDAIVTGVLARQTDGLLIERVVITDMANRAIIADPNDTTFVAAAPAVLRDVDVRRVGLDGAGGVDEVYGIAVGSTAELTRVRVRDVGGVALDMRTACIDTRVDLLTIAGVATGVFTRTGTNGLVIEASSITSAEVGVHLTVMTLGTELSRISFTGQSYAAIVDETGAASIGDNDYTRIAPGAVQVTSVPPP